ncbi:MAG: carbon-nitrogen hydrolase family protein [Gammaproteobacteria bacterium]
MNREPQRSHAAQPTATYHVAAVQMVSSLNVGTNLAAAAQLIEAAAGAGARLVVLPENFAYLGNEAEPAPVVSERYQAGPIQQFLAQAAKHHGIWIVGGTIPLQADDKGKVYAACLLYDDQGQVVARYDKIHLFDVSVGDPPRSYRESLSVEPGRQVVVAETPFGKLGLAVCYDLRFPELFRAMVVQGMELLAVPAAFTAVTGAAHWEVLLRARAIENLCYVVAAAQGGEHACGRETYGHSLLVDPWGEVLARLGQGPGIVDGEFDRCQAELIRERFPSLQHIRIVGKNTHEPIPSAGKKPHP